MNESMSQPMPSFMSLVNWELSFCVKGRKNGMFPQGKNEYAVFSVTLNSHNCLLCSMLRKMTGRILFCHKVVPAYFTLITLIPLQFISICFKQVNQLQARTFLRTQAFTIFPSYLYFQEIKSRKDNS